VYLRIEIPKARVKRMALRPKKKTESQYSQSDLNGMLMNRSETTPVPMVTENHDGEKLRTIRRHPTSYLDLGSKVGSSWQSRGSGFPAGSPMRSEADTVIICARDRVRLRPTVDECESV
jgi:hypothetical protein